MKLYEGMFVVDYNAAKEDYEKMEGEVHEILKRFECEVVNSLRWDDRRLAYDIKKHKRGCFILVHFNAEGDAIPKIERQVQYSEQVIRCLLTCDEDGVEAEPFSAQRDDFRGPGGEREERGGRGGRGGGGGGGGRGGRRRDG